MFSNKTAIIYNAKQYKTTTQYAKARIVEPKAGKSAIVIMSDPAMTNYAGVMVETVVLNRFLRIITGTSPTNVTIRASWQNPSLWAETDDVAIDYNPTTKTYTGYLNGVSRVTWADTAATPVVSTGTTKRSQGFLFDIMA